MRLWSYDNGNIEVNVHEWTVRDTALKFYTVKQVFKDGFGKYLGQQEYEFQTFTEASELAARLINKNSLEN